MTSSVPATTIRIDPEVKREAVAVLDELGLSMSGAVNVFLRAVIREGGMPFDVRLAPAEKADEDGTGSPQRPR
ncbi:type II toxin-antitoxin system RelB/DinJ family antitoxin [Collinsella aerofaciens]|uniref:Bifunctional antitoxin/transcriptional repressor RelB n=1 Tax=Collinsella aerofaciens TaxID=74426 RepID=A0A174I0N6_9ACTN|nr:type II toxin-antitoxin system RelB/DinJ family antitoxin [Collinsella aerofaciens]CUO80724.1 bifunctional antitoxin/transcriptional repressor RelB [Collinsella aerofaciens]